MVLSVTPDIQYAAESKTSWHTLDFFKSDSSHKPQPLLVFVHGGAWRSGDKKEMHQFAHYFVAQTGYAVALVNYRLTYEAQPITHPAHSEDVLTALEYLLLPNPLVYDRSNLHLAGHSCGAHILTSIFLDSQNVTPSLKPSHALVQAVRSISLSEGLYDLDLLLKTWPDYRGFVSGAFGEHASFDKYSTVNYSAINPDIRWFVIHSTGDELVDQAQSEVIWNHLQSQKADVTKDWTTLDGKHNGILDQSAYAQVIADFVSKK
jgi:acetyl esterase/lipase